MGTTSQCPKWVETPRTCIIMTDARGPAGKCLEPFTRNCGTTSALRLLSYPSLYLAFAVVCTDLSPSGRPIRVTSIVSILSHDCKLKQKRNGFSDLTRLWAGLEAGLEASAIS